LSQPIFQDVQLFRTVARGNPSADGSDHRLAYRGNIVEDEGIGQTSGHTLCTTNDAPNEPTIRGIEFADPSFGFDDLWSVKPEPTLMGDQHPRAQTCANAHAPERPQWARGDADHRTQATQLDYRREYLSHRVEGERRLLESYSARLEDEHGTRGLSCSRVPRCEAECPGYLGPRHLTDTTALKRTLDSEGHTWLTVEGALNDHDAVVCLRYQTLGLEPG
jgi:hypothetical protein